MFLKVIEMKGSFVNMLALPGEDPHSHHHLRPQPHLHILSERRPDDPPATNHKSGFVLGDDASTNQKTGFSHPGTEGGSNHLVSLDAQNHGQQHSHIQLYLHHEVDKTRNEFLEINILCS